MASQTCDHLLLFNYWYNSVTGTNTCLLRDAFDILSTTFVTCVSLIKFCGKPSIPHPIYHSHLLNTIVYCANLNVFGISFMPLCQINYIPAVQVLYTGN